MPALMITARSERFRQSDGEFLKPRMIDQSRMVPTSLVQSVTARETLPLKMPTPTVNAALADLERLGIVEEVTGRKRGRVFRYRRYLSRSSLNKSTMRVAALNAWLAVWRHHQGRSRARLPNGLAHGPVEAVDNIPFDES